MDEDWCLLSDDEDFVDVIASPRDETEPEPEPGPTALVAPPPPVDTDDGISLDDIDISTLLQDKLTAFDATDAQIAKRRAFSLSLLDSKHRHCRPAQARGRCVEVHHGATILRKRSVKLAFSESSAAATSRPMSFPARLRAEMTSRRQATANEPPTFAPLIAFTQEQGTQVNLDDVSDANARTLSPTAETRAFRLQRALERNMSVTNQLKGKSQDHERVALKLLNAEALLESSDYRHERDLFKLRRLESGLMLAKSREKLDLDVQAQLQAEIEELRKQNAELKRTNELLAGELTEDAGLLDQSIDDLEKLEISISKGMDSVRAAIRHKYKEAIARKHEDSLCVICLANPVSVVLLPCRHQVLCGACALRVTTCPVDRQDIQDKVLTFGLNAYLS